MNLLQSVRDQFNSLTRPKALSHRPDLEGREHVYRQGAGQIVQAMDNYADYATVYSTYVWVQKAVAKLAENISSLPVRVVDGKGKEITGHPLNELFARPNDAQTAIDLWGSYVVHMMLGGEGPLEIVPDQRGLPAELWARRPDRVAVVPDITRLVYPSAFGYIYEPEEAAANTITIEAKYMVFDKFYNPINPWRGIAPIHAVREGITIDLFAQGWSKSFLKNNARPDFAIVAPQGITKTEKEEYEARFMMRHQGATHAHLPVILEAGVTDIKTFSFPPKDIEWLEQRKYSRDEVGAIFNVPDEIMGYGRDTYENFETALSVFWTLGIVPITRRRDVTLTHHFMRYGLGLQPGQRIDTDLSEVGVLQEDLTPKVDLALKIWSMGVPFNTLDTTLNLGIGNVEGGEIGYLASSLKTVDQIVNPPEPPAPVMAPGAPRPPKDDASQQRMMLPEGAKGQAIRILKRLIQEVQNVHLQAVRHGAGVDPGWNLGGFDRTELRRWIGDDTDAVIAQIEGAVLEIKGDHDAVSKAYADLKSDATLTRLLEVEASAPFFTHGVTIRELYKALVLQLDPDDDDAEQQMREQLEKRFERELAKSLSQQLDTLLPEGASDEMIRNAPYQVGASSDPVRETLRRNLESGAELGVSVAAETLEQIAIGFDFNMANVRASRWASQYSYELVRGLNETTQARLQQAVNDWFLERSTTLRDLTKELEGTFGRKRARMIAHTETTRAAAQGAITGYEESRVVQEMEWLAASGERTCPTCNGLHGTRATLRGTFPGGYGPPPAHPLCRCTVVPVVER